MANAQSRGWGAPCTGSRKVVTFQGWSFDSKSRATVKIPVRAEIAELVGLLCREADRRGYKIRTGATWGFACRKIRGGSSWSNHAWALAVDLNSDRNPMVRRNGRSTFDKSLTDMPPWLPALFKEYGFGWGGDYRNTADAMHFEFMGSPADARKHTERARHKLAGGAAPSPAGNGKPGAAYPGGVFKLTSPMMRHPFIESLQEVANAAGCDAGKPDGVFGKGTDSGIRCLQRKLNVPDDGAWGPKSQAALDALFAYLAAVGKK